MKETDKEYPYLKEYAAELAGLENTPPAAIELPPLAAIAIISHVQLATRHPSLAGKDGMTKIAIDAARQLQGLFNPESATYKVLELGWNASEDLPRHTPVVKDPQLMEAIKNYFEREGIDLDSGESIDNYIGEAQLDRFIDPEETRRDGFDEDFYHGKTHSERCRDEGIDPCYDIW